MYTYYQLYKNSKDPLPFRINIAKNAKKLKSSTNAVMFILEHTSHLEKHGVDLEEFTIQIDNGNEFSTPWNSILDSAITKALEHIMKSKSIQRHTESCLPL